MKLHLVIPHEQIQIQDMLLNEASKSNINLEFVNFSDTFKQAKLWCETNRECDAHVVFTHAESGSTEETKAYWLQKMRSLRNDDRFIVLITEEVNNNQFINELIKLRMYDFFLLNNSVNVETMLNWILSEKRNFSDIEKYITKEEKPTSTQSSEGTKPEDTSPTTKKDEISEIHAGPIAKEKLVITKVEKRTVRRTNAQSSKTILFLSSQRRIGTTTVASSLANAYSLNKTKTCYIDLDNITKGSYLRFPVKYESAIGKLDNNSLYGILGEDVNRYLRHFGEYYEKNYDLNEDGVMGLIRYAKENYNITIIDVSSNTDEAFLKQIMNASTDIVIVTEQELSNIEETIKLATKYKSVLPTTHLLINNFAHLRTYTPKFIKSLLNDREITIKTILTLDNYNQEIKEWLETRKYSTKTCKHLHHEVKNLINQIG